MKSTFELFIDDLDWPDAEGVESTQHATVECVYSFTRGYPADHWEPAAPDEVELLSLRVIASDVPAEQWPAFGRYITSALSEWIEERILASEAESYEPSF